MSYKTLVDDYLSIPEEGEENKEDGKSSLGVHTMGETMAHIRLAGDDELYEKGFEVLTPDIPRSIEEVESTVQS